MSARRFALALLAALLLAACDARKESTFQGWVEAELIFVGPDEAGRVETLTVREGDQVERGMLLFTIDPDLQQADVAMQEAAVKNAQLAYDRAVTLMKTQAGTQKTLDDAEAALRTAQARLNSAQTRLTRRKVFSPVAGPVQQIYFRVGEMVPAGKAIVALLPPGNLKVRFFVNEATLPRISPATRSRFTATAAAATLPPRSPSSRVPPNSRRRSSTASRNARSSSFSSRRAPPRPSGCASASRSA